MIGRLRGKIWEKAPPTLVLDVNGVGYQVEAPMSTFYQLPEPQAEVTLYIHFVVREDAQLLYGFYKEHERALFRALIKVNGVGPKLALTILSSIEADDFVSCIADNDSVSLTRLPGVGKKTAQRLVIEMRDRLADWNLPSEKTVSSTGLPMNTVSKQPTQEAISALISLGYKPQEASRAVAGVRAGATTSEDMIRMALQAMVKA